MTTWANQDKSGLSLTWDDATFIWNDATGTWDNPFAFTYGVKSDTSWANGVKDSTAFTNQAKS